MQLRGKKAHSNPDWDVHKDYGQPKWDGNGFAHDPTDTSDPRMHSAEQGYYEREQRALRSPFDVKEIIERFDKWVKHHPNEMYRIVWCQSLRYEILNDEKAPEEGIQRLAMYACGNELYRSKAGTLKLRREQWLNNFYSVDRRLREKLAQLLKEILRA